MSLTIFRLLISNFHRVLYVVCFLLGNSQASEFYMPTFWNTLFHLHRHVGVELLNFEKGDNHLQHNIFDLLSHGPT